MRANGFVQYHGGWLMRDEYIHFVGYQVLIVAVCQSEKDGIADRAAAIWKKCTFAGEIANPIASHRQIS